MIVIDTHVLIWFAQGDPKLGQAARQLIEQNAATQDVLVPTIVPWEVALVVARNQVTLGMDVLPWMKSTLSNRDFKLAPLEPEIAIASVDLTWAHKDPADRMIVATAQHWRAPLVTADRAIIAYAADQALEVIDARL